MNAKVIRSFLTFVPLLFWLSACTLFSPMPSPTAEIGIIHTQAAQTISVQLTQVAATTTPTAMPVVLTATATQPAATQIPPTDTPIPATDTPTAAPTATATATPKPCNWAQFVSDVRVSDGMTFTPNSAITKTWRLKNIGDCTWTSDYDLVFASGDRMDGPSAVDMPKTVKPGETVDISVELTTPKNEGAYRGNWQLRTNTNLLFGIGANAANPFWVEIKVAKASKYVYDFGLNYCAAEWYGDAGQLPCPGVSDDEDGFVVFVSSPKIEIGRQENESGIWTQPEDKKDSWIRGEYPQITVETGYHFKAIVGCLDGASKCDVIFQLNYRVDGGAMQTFWQQHETYDGVYTNVDVDLSSLAGEKVEFLLTVLANGSAKEDKAFWLVPRIVKVD